MAGKGPAPKPAHLRQRTNKKVGATTLDAPVNPDIPAIPNPDGRVWHPLTVSQWDRAWRSPMSTQWLQTDFDGLGRLALLWDDFNNKPGDVRLSAEIRQQEQRFGFSPLDRSRLQWEMSRAEGAESKQAKREANDVKGDPRKLLTMVK